MRKNISIKQNINELLEQISIETGLKQSAVIEKAILLFNENYKKEKQK